MYTAQPLYYVPVYSAAPRARMAEGVQVILASILTSILTSDWSPYLNTDL